MQNPEGQFCRKEEESAEGWSSLSGIVDLCPCIKLSPGRTHQILLDLKCQAKEQEGLGQSSTASHLHEEKYPCIIARWHECQHDYGNLEVSIRIELFLFSSGSLGVRTEYDCVHKPGTFPQRPRLCCPHHGVDLWMDEVLACRKDHPWTEYCTECFDLRGCDHCTTRMTETTIQGNVAEGRFAYSFSTERSLDDMSWDLQVVFPFCRLFSHREYPQTLPSANTDLPFHLTEG